MKLDFWLPRMLAAVVVVVVLVIVMLKAETGAIDKHLLKSVNSRYLFVVVAGLPGRRLGVNPMIRRLLRRCSDWIAFV